METDPELNNLIKQIKVNTNESELKLLARGMILLQQVKPSTALKQLAFIGLAKMEQEKKMLRNTIENIRCNRRVGIFELNAEIINSLRKVPRS